MPSYMSPNAGGWGEELRRLSQWELCAHGAQINFRDLTPYLTYAEYKPRLGIPTKVFKQSSTAIFLPFFNILVLCKLFEHIPQTREYWMIYSGPGCLAVVWFGSSSPPVSRLSPVCPHSSLRTAGHEGWARSRIIGPRENLVPYKSFSSLCLILFIAETESNSSLTRNKSFI